MATKVTFGFGTLLFATLLFLSGAERVKNKIYDDIQGDMACFKRFNGTHEIGCTSKFGGNHGVLHVIREKEDLTWVYEQGPHKPYILAITPAFLTQAVLEQARDSGKVSGVVVLVAPSFDPETLLLDGFSGEQHCPNRELGLYNDSSNPDYSGYCEQKPWNPYGSGLLYMSWDFPIFLVDNTSSIDSIEACYDKFNKPELGVARHWPLCSMELKAHMFGTTNTEVCLRRARLGVISRINFCDPLSDWNVWGTLHPMNRSHVVPDKSVIVVAARMDAATMFDNISPGANSAVSGLVTLMAAAGALFKHRQDIQEVKNDKNILFILLQGETWDYIGSSRVVYDMEKGQFPFKLKDDTPDQMANINLTHIDYIIELEQVGQALDTHQLYYHTDPISNADPDIKSETEKLLMAFDLAADRLNHTLNFTRVDEAAPLPPASLQSFLKRTNISGLVITDHRDKFKNPYYESIFDDYRNVKYEADNETNPDDRYHQHINDMASVLATALYTLVTGESKTVIADKDKTNELLYCYLKNSSCDLFQAYAGDQLKNYLAPKPAKMYTSVEHGEGWRTHLTSFILAGLLGNRVDVNKSDCKRERLSQVNQLYYFPLLDNGTCIQSTVRVTEALSPAFIIDNYNWQSGEYSTWAESGWELTKAMIYLRPSVGAEVAVVCGGVASFLLALVLVHLMNSRADLLFGLTTPPAAC